MPPGVNRNYYGFPGYPYTGFNQPRYYGYNSSPYANQSGGRTRDVFDSLSTDEIGKFNFSDWISNNWGSGYTVSRNAMQAEYEAAMLHTLGKLPYKPYAVYNPSQLYTNTNANYIRRLERSNNRGLYNSIVNVDRFTRLGRREDGDRIRGERFERLQSQGVFDLLDKSNYFTASSQLRAFMQDDFHRHANLGSGRVTSGFSRWVESVKDGKKVKELVMGSEGGLDMDGNFNEKLLPKVVKTIEIA